MSASSRLLFLRLISLSIAMCLAIHASNYLPLQARRLRFAVFHVVADLPLTNPYMKIALLKWCYRQPPKFGYCPIPDTGRLKALKPEELNDAEKVLRYFHLDAQGYLKTLSAFEKAQFLGNADSTVVDAVLSCGKTAETAVRAKALCEHVRPLLLRLKNLWPQMDVAKLPDFCDADSSAQSVQQKEEAALLLPRVIAYDNLGCPITFQDEVEIGSNVQDEEFDWEDWVALEQVQNAYLKEMAKAAVVTATLGLYLKDRPINNFKLVRSKGKVKVISTVEVPVGKLCVPLVVTHPNNLLDKSDHPHAVQVTHKVTEPDGKCNTVALYASPEWSLPKAPPAGKTHEWSRKNAVLFFWGFRRDDENWNCEVVSFVTNIVQVLRLNQVQELDGAEPKSITAELVVPLITNVRVIKPGEEVVVRCAKPVPKAKPKQVKTWRNDVSQPSKKPKTGV